VGSGFRGCWGSFIVDLERSSGTKDEFQIEDYDNETLLVHAK